MTKVTELLLALPKEPGDDRLASRDVGNECRRPDRVKRLVRISVIAEFHSRIEPALEVGDLAISHQLVDLAFIDEADCREVMAAQFPQDRRVQIIDVILIGEDGQCR